MKFLTTMRLGTLLLLAGIVGLLLSQGSALQYWAATLALIGGALAISGFRERRESVVQVEGQDFGGELMRSNPEIAAAFSSPSVFQSAVAEIAAGRLITGIRIIRIDAGVSLMEAKARAERIQAAITSLRGS